MSAISLTSFEQTWNQSISPKTETNYRTYSIWAERASLVFFVAIPIITSLALTFLASSIIASKNTDIPTTDIPPPVSLVFTSLIVCSSILMTAIGCKFFSDKSTQLSCFAERIKKIRTIYENELQHNKLNPEAKSLSLAAKESLGILLKESLPIVKKFLIRHDTVFYSTLDIITGKLEKAAHYWKDVVLQPAHEDFCFFLEKLAKNPEDFQKTISHHGINLFPVFFDRVILDTISKKTKALSLDLESGEKTEAEKELNYQAFMEKEA